MRVRVRVRVRTRMRMRGEAEDVVRVRVGVRVQTVLSAHANRLSPSFARRNEGPFFFFLGPLELLCWLRQRKGLSVVAPVKGFQSFYREDTGER